MVKIVNREHWLTNFVDACRKPFAKAFEAPIPDRILISVGFSSKGARSKVIGECHYVGKDADRGAQVFIHPGIADASEAAHIAVHELIHAALGPKVETAHGKEFKKVALKAGLEGKMKATVPGAKSREWVDPIVAKLGPYPHERLVTSILPRVQPTVQQKNVTCPVCDFAAKVRVDQMHLGRLVCPADGDILLMKDESPEEAGVGKYNDDPFSGGDDE